tara:strand:- start:286 stop:867 length:582 start_codon:yes stop_codon:yes gene_type:complete
LLSAALALFSGKGKRLHLNAGNIYFWGMLGVFLTAIPMSMLTGNIFLFLIAVFSFYLAFAGRRFAKNRTGLAERIDWIAVSLMLFSGVGMWGLAVWFFTQDNSQYIVLVVFGLLALILGYADFSAHKSKTAKGKERIARHLTNMLGGTIAVVTAVLVVNVQMEPVWVPWVLPTAVMTPVIVWWNRKVLNGRTD